jgi:hypothetical protein
MKSYQVRRVQGLRDWSASLLLDDFTCPWQADAVPLTQFRALCDDEQLYFRFDCVDHDLVLAGGDNVRERVVGSDRVEIFLTPTLKLDPYYCLEMDARGEVLAYRSRLYRQFDWDWQCPGLSVAAGIDGQRYWVEGRLPLATLRALDVLKPGARELHAGVYRGEFSHNADGSVHHGWLPWIDPRTEKADFHVPESFGRFVLEERFQ